MSTQKHPVLEPRQLNDADEKILDELRHGRASPSYLADQTGVEQTYINQRLRRLDEHGHVENLARGLWELVEDPREDQPPRPYTWGDVEQTRQFIARIDEQIEKRERGEVEGDAESLRERKEALESILDEILEEVDSDELD